MLACMYVRPPVFAPEGSRIAVAPESQAFGVPAIWEYSTPLISPEKRSRDQSISQKDPSLVYYRDSWHHQGLLERDKAGRNYGQFPWRIGMLTPVQ
jgi:hypothetical protein